MFTVVLGGEGCVNFLYDSAFLTNLPVSPGFFFENPLPLLHTHTHTHTHTHKEGDTYKFMTPPPPNFVNALKIYLG